MFFTLRKAFAKKIGLAAIAIMIAAGPALRPVTTYAADTAETLTDSELTMLAGYLLSDVMNLILEEYAGEAVTPDELYEAALRGMSGILDPYSGYLDENESDQFTGSLSGKLFGIGVTIRMNKDGKPEIMRVLPDSPALKVGLQKGDIITAVNSLSVDGLTTNEIVERIVSSPDRRVVLQIKRVNRLMTFDITKDEIKSITVFTDKPKDIFGSSQSALWSSYRYLSITSISSTTSDDLKTALTKMKSEGAKGFVLDLRGNTGGYLEAAVEICQQLVPQGPIVHTIDNSGVKRTVYSSLKKAPFDNIVVLVDGDTASAAELISAAMQDSGTVVIGETTYGKGVIQTLFPLQAGGVFKLTTAEYLRRSGERINRIGVIPDHMIKTVASDYGTPDDVALLKAFEMLSAK